MKIQFIKSHSAYSYFVGDIGEITDKKAQKLIDSGFAKQVEAETLPEEMPARELLLEAGYRTISDFKGKLAESLTVVKGIGEKTAEEIIDFVEKWEQ